MSDFWHRIGCCVAAKPPTKRKRGRRIDRSMIGEPTNFIHLTHIGSGDTGDGQLSGSVQEQMRSKGPTTNGRNSLLTA
ncbi:CDC42 small effector protein 1 [Nelusetta ayraudi]|uniref:CDC42 small effector protein 1 n=1 Tax=Nelusetta ayraudi TaxID=303726 RepID=UPI003F730CC0